MTRLLGWLLGLENVASIDEVKVSLAAPWATQGTGPFWLFLAALLLFSAAVAFYLRYQSRGSTSARFLLGVCRGCLLALLMVTLAEPVLRVSVTNIQKPLLYVVFDGTESMQIRDVYPSDQLNQLRNAVAADSAMSQQPSRLELLKSFLNRSQENVLKELQKKADCRLEAFVFDGASVSQLRKLKLNDAGKFEIDPKYLAQQITTTGQVTALGSVVDDVSQQFGAGELSGIIVISDFANNWGMPPVGSQFGRESPAARLGVPIYAVGLGATEAADLSVDLQTEAKIRQGQLTIIHAKLQQTELEGQKATVRVTALPENPSESSDQTVLVGEKTVTLTGPLTVVDFPFKPRDAGRFKFIVEARPIAGEVVEANNKASRDVNIIDDYVRLMYVAYEPGWEWRFIKEVFHRDKTVGMKGFRTFVASSDPRVRESNELFLTTLTPERNVFFANDVLFLDDVPRSMLTPRFCKMVKEFVNVLGGGLVVIAGPRFGIRQLVGTELADMMPVIIDREARYNDADDRVFRPKLTVSARKYAFMRLGDSDDEDRRAWDSLKRLPWYQPVAQKHQRAEVLAEHPNDVCSDGRTKQPLIAVRRFGEGEVVYIGFNETWRLRKMHGEKYYRRFWSPLIDRLGMSHALGNRKRFVPRIPQSQYRVEDTVALSVQAYDQNYLPLSEEVLSAKSLTAQLIVQPKGTAASKVKEMEVPMLRPGLFEARWPVFVAGNYRIRVKDPITGEFFERAFEVTSVAAERRSGVRDAKLQRELATETKGRHYTLVNAEKMIDDIKVQAKREKVTRNHALWNTPLWFILLVVLMLGEWTARKWIRLT